MAEFEQPRRQAHLTGRKPSDAATTKTPSHPRHRSWSALNTLRRRQAAAHPATPRCRWPRCRATPSTSSWQDPRATTTSARFADYVMLILPQAGQIGRGQTVRTANSAMTYPLISACRLGPAVDLQISDLAKRQNDLRRDLRRSEARGHRADRRRSDRRTCASRVGDYPAGQGAATADGGRVTFTG